MAAYEVKVTVASATDLKNVNWRYGPTRPYVIVWIDPEQKSSTHVDEDGDTFPYWGETLVIAVPPGQPIDDSILHIDVVHAGNEEDTRRLIGSARLDLAGVLQDGGVGDPVARILKLKRPSGRHQGKLEVEVCVKETCYSSRDAYYAPPYEVPLAGSEYSAPPPPLQQPGYGYQYGGESYDVPPATYGQPTEIADQKKSKFGGMGMGMGLAVGAVAGVLGGLALSEGADAVEDDIADDAAERVEDEEYDDDGDF